MNIVLPMRLISVIVLLALVLSAIPLVHNYSSAEASVPALTSLDVCDTSGNVISVNADSPALQESCCNLFPPVLWGHAEITYTPVKLFAVFFQLERPPKS